MKGESCEERSGDPGTWRSWEEASQGLHHPQLRGTVVGRYRNFGEDEGFAPEGHCDLLGDILGAEVGVETLPAGVKM